MTIYDTFTPRLDAHWRQFTRGNGRIDLTGSSIRMVTEAASDDQYCNAQLDDFFHPPRNHLRWQPPLRLVLRARFSHPAGVLRGTAGFGFWNNPAFWVEEVRPLLPQATWFFYASAPSNLKLDVHTPGTGWKAATIDTASFPAPLLIPTAPWSFRSCPSRPVIARCGRRFSKPCASVKRP
ncbi:MAG: hypothetical protein HC837_13975 [Chloroflexaceae bacterium]|nr:hypothetical protein [Chloroflexaceae bacterium]